MAIQLLKGQGLRGRLTAPGRPGVPTPIAVSSNGHSALTHAMHTHAQRGSASSGIHLLHHHIPRVQTAAIRRTRLAYKKGRIR